MSFSLISQLGFSQKPFLSHITSTLTYELDKSLFISLEIFSYTFFDCSSLTNFIQELQNKKTYEKISSLIGKDLSKSYVRVEVICDRKGFWLKPHCDIKEKLISCLLFVNKFNESEDLGTDFYDNELKKVKTLPYRDNYGYFFSSGPNTWHGMEKKEIVKERRCLQVNYVTFKTDWKVED